jgi:DNA-binding CsgD family transcriptional regulator
MLTETVYRSVKRLCYAGLDSVTLRTQAMERIGRALDYDSHAFGTTDPDTGLLNHFVARDMPAALALAYVDRIYPWSSARYTIDAARRGTPVFPAGAETPELADFQRANGLRYGVDVVFPTGDRLWGKWCLLREQRGASDIVADAALLRRLVPHVSRGLQQAALIDAARIQTPRGAATTAVIVLDDAGHPTLRSAAAPAMLADIADVGVEFDGGIPVAVLALALRVRRAARQAIDGVAVTEMNRVRGRSGSWYVVQANLAEPDVAGRASTVIALRPLGPREMAPMLSSLYGLSPREREVVAAVVRGDTTKEIAARLTISPATVKEHLDRACAKTGARGRRALIARLFRDVYQPALMA